MRKNQKKNPFQKKLDPKFFFPKIPNISDFFEIFEIFKISTENLIRPCKFDFSFRRLFKFKKKGGAGQNPYFIFHIFPKFLNLTHKWNMIADMYIRLLTNVQNVTLRFKICAKCYFAVQNMRKKFQIFEILLCGSKSENRLNTNKF